MTKSRIENMKAPIDKILESGYRPISGRFAYPVRQGKGTLRFIWDGAAMNGGSHLVLVEEELCDPVPLHIQGHVTRASYMLEKGEGVQRIAWVVHRENFNRLWQIVEDWRDALRSACGVDTPPCDYFDEKGVRLASST